MDLGDETLAELFEQYKDEVRESIGALDSELVAIEQDPANSEVIFSIFRNLHSLKGSSKMFNVDNIGHIAHKLEDLMQIIDQDNSILGRHPKIVDLLFRGADIFRAIIDKLESDISFINLTPEHAGFIEEINRQLDLISRKENVLAEAAKTLIDELDSILPALEDIDSTKIRSAILELETCIKLIEVQEGGGAARYLYKDADITKYVASFETGLEKFHEDSYLDEDTADFLISCEELINTLFEVADEDIMGVLGELNDGLDMYKEKGLEMDPMIIEFFSMVLEDLKTHFHIEVDAGKDEIKVKPQAYLKDASESAAEDDDRKIQAKTIRVDEKKIDLFLESVGKLITQSEILNHLQFSFREAGVNPSIVRDFATVNRTISNDIINLQRSIMEVRQVEMNNILKKFPRLVRDISHSMGKEVELNITGERIPIDKSLLDDVEQAMIHIVRNAIDHGLETPDIREENNKSRRGRIDINVIQEEASILVETIDDGRGIDFEAVKRKAWDRGMITDEEYENMSDTEAESLIYRSGITTKEEATDISGRGVGLDVVMSNIKKWNGEVMLETARGSGLAVRLRIPITNTLLTKEAILLKLNKEMFCLPLESVLEIVTIDREKLHCHKDRYIFQHRDKIVNVVNLKGLLGLGAMGEANGISNTFILLKGKAGARKAIAADEIVGQQKIVIKDFEIPAFRRLPYYLGLTLLGDGRVVLILDGENIADNDNY